MAARKRVPGGVVHRLPDDLRDAVVSSPTALAAWNDITPLARNEFICWVEDAKQAKTRARRVRRSREELEGGMRRPCCWPGCSHRERTGSATKLAPRPARTRALSPQAKVDRILAMFMELPDTHVVVKWGSPHLCVDDKLLGGPGLHEGRVLLTCKLEMSHAIARVADDPRCRPAKYTGKHGWVTMDATDTEDWDEIRSLVMEGYRMVAPKASLAKLRAGMTTPPGSRGSKRTGRSPRARG
jgi:predicted DNA-binding protein (MmcQ/YjbR family)